MHCFKENILIDIKDYCFYFGELTNQICRIDVLKSGNSLEIHSETVTSEIMSWSYLQNMRERLR